MPSTGRHSYVTLATNDEYAIGALVLGYSLRRTGTNKELTILITEGVPQNFRKILQDVYNNVITVNPLRRWCEPNVILPSRPNLGITYMKLYCWKLVEFSKCVFLDADTIVLQNIDELFEREELSAAPDTSWPDIFNSGVFVFRPCLKTFSELSELAETGGSFDGGDQGLLNEYFSRWSTETLEKHLPFSYNCSCWVLPNDRLVFYARAPAWKKFSNQVKVAHFAGLGKPWRHRMAINDEAICRAIEDLEGSNTSFTATEQTCVLALWWAFFFKRVKPQLNYGMFLSTIFEPVPPPPPPPTPFESLGCQWQESENFYFEDQPYHPEFHDTSFDYLHNGQRVDQAGQYEEFYGHSQHVNSIDNQQHRYHEQERHEPSCHQKAVQEKGQNHFPKHLEESHIQQSSPKHRKEDGITSHEHSPPCHELKHREEEIPWRGPRCQQQPPQQRGWSVPVQSDQFAGQVSATPHCGQNHVETQRNTPSFESPPSPPPPPPSSPHRPEQPLSPEIRNDKDPLFFAPKPMCSECLMELKWSKEFLDPLHRELLAPLPPFSSGVRLRRRSSPPWTPLPQLFGSTQPILQNAVVEEPQKVNGTQCRKREKGGCLHHIQKTRSNPKRRLKKSLVMSKLVDAARRRAQSKEDDKISVTVPPPESTPDKCRTQPREQDKTIIPTAPGMISTPLNATSNEQIKSNEGDDITLPSMRTSAPAFSTGRKKTLTESREEEDMSRPPEGTESTPSQISKPPKRLTQPNECKPSSFQKTQTSMPAVTNTVSTATMTTAKSSDLEVLISDDLPPHQLEIVAPNPSDLVSKRRVYSMGKETMQASNEKTRENAPWLPRMVGVRSVPHQISEGSAYLCDRHRPHPPPPDWRMTAWERGDIDYTGNDRFSNILARIRATIRQTEGDTMPIGIWL